jgi:hypothetical protein
MGHLIMSACVSSEGRNALSTCLGLVGAALALAVTGCKTSPSMDYAPGYDRMLTAQNYSSRARDQAVVIVGGAPAVWQKADEPSYAFETRPRYSSGGDRYDVALVKPGLYQLQTVVLGGGQFAQFGGFSGLGVSSSNQYASFAATAGEVVYVGDLMVDIVSLARTECNASLSVRNSSPAVGTAFAQQFPYVKGNPRTNLMTVMQSEVRFPGECQ